MEAPSEVATMETSSVDGTMKIPAVSVLVEEASTDGSVEAPDDAAVPCVVETVATVPEGGKSELAAIGDAAVDTACTRTVEEIVEPGQQDTGFEVGGSVPAIDTSKDMSTPALSSPVQPGVDLESTQVIDDMALAAMADPPQRQQLQQKHVDAKVGSGGETRSEILVPERHEIEEDKQVLAGVSSEAISEDIPQPQAKLCDAPTAQNETDSVTVKADGVVQAEVTAPSPEGTADLAHVKFSDMGNIFNEYDEDVTSNTPGQAQIQTAEAAPSTAVQRGIQDFQSAPTTETADIQKKRTATTYTAQTKNAAANVAAPRPEQTQQVTKEAAHTKV